MYFGEQIKRLNEAIAKQANNDMRDMAVTYPQMLILFKLAELEDGIASLKTLEKAFKLSQPTIAGLAVRLEYKGLIESFKKAEDKRTKYIRLTDEGRSDRKSTRLNSSH